MDPVAEAEREKYERVYGAGLYQPKDSVGDRVVPIAWGWAAGLWSVDATDWGCGHGRATRWLRARGLEVHGIDLVRCGDMQDDPRFHQGTIWAPPASLPATDFAFSADVLEHLPVDQVVPALENMSRLTRIGGWLQVATIPDQRGAEIGQKLHLTVRDAGWWIGQVGRFFEIEAWEVTEREVRLWLKT